MNAPDRHLIRAGFVLMLLAMLTGLAIPLFRAPRMALGAHVTGAMAGLMLIGVGLAWPYLVGGQKIGRAIRVLMLASAYGNWGTGLLAASLGTNRLTPLNGGPGAPDAAQESIVAVLQVAQGVAIIVALLLVIYELRSRRMESNERARTAA